MRILRFFALLAAAAAAQQSPLQTGVKFSSTSNLVVVDVTVRDKSGNVMEGLTKNDFTILEDGKPQKLSVFEFQKLEFEVPKDVPKEAPPPLDKTDATEEKRKQQITVPTGGQVQYQDKRLLVMYFDFGAMPIPDQLRAQEAALKFITDQMTPSDMIAIMTMRGSVKVEQDFTNDKDLLRSIINAFPIGEMAEMSELADNGDDDTNEDTGAAFTVDQSEFNIFNTDMKLTGLEKACEKLAPLPEKKALLYFSGGIGKTGIENQAQIKSTINTAMKANVAFYPMDTSGLSADPPGGDASKAAPRGKGLYTGAHQRAGQMGRHDKQETLVTLAAETGGKAFLDSNDLVVGMKDVQKDIRSYYILGYYSTNDAQDGRFRRISVKLTKKEISAKLDYRSGYFAQKVFGKFTGADKEKQLEEALSLGDPITDIPMALEVDYFRISRTRYFVPVSVKLPGSAVQLTAKKGTQITDIDFLGQIIDARRKSVGSVRDFIRIKLTEDNAAQLAKRSLQYDTGFMLPAGKYRMKFLARDNSSGKMGTFDMRFEIPDLNPEPLPLPVTPPLLTEIGEIETGATPSPFKEPEKPTIRLSSVIWSNQREPVQAAVGAVSAQKKLLAANPLIFNNEKLIPNVTRVYKKDQKLYVYFEVYDPATDSKTNSFDVAATLSIFDRRGKRFETEPVRLSGLAPGRFNTVPVQLQLPLKNMRAGKYICQVNVVDHIARKFALPRTQMVLLP